MITNLLKNTFKYSSQFNKVLYINGKSVLSLSQMIGGNKPYMGHFMSNFYIKQHTQHQNKQEGQISAQVLQDQQRLLKTVLQKDLIVRCIIAPEICKKQMNLNINTLKRNPLMLHLMQLKQRGQYKFNVPRILINSFIHTDQGRQVLKNFQTGQTHIQFKQSSLPVHSAMHGKSLIKEQVWTDAGLTVHQIQQHLKRNILQLQKLFVDGLSLDISFMLSKTNLHRRIKSGLKQKGNAWLKCLQRKSKAIHSNIVQNGLSLAETIHEEGYQLHHLFLSSFDRDGCQVSSLERNQAYDLKEVLYILGMINFNGKIIVDCKDMGDPLQFQRNLEFLDRTLKEIGFKKTSVDDMDDGSYISAL